MKIAGRIISLTVLGILFFWLGLALFLTLDVPDPPLASSGEAVVILGAGYYKDGQPVPALEARLKTGIRLWNTLEQRPKLIISGRLEEVQVMEQYLLNAGIPQKSIVHDTKGTNTAATVRGLRGTEGCNIFVTQAYHLLRVRLYAAAYGVEGVYCPADTVPITFAALFPLAARESLAILAFPFQWMFPEMHRD